MADPQYTSLDELLQLVDPKFVKQKKINCISLIRQITGKGWNDAENFFEQIWEPTVMGGFPFHPSEIKSTLIGSYNQILKDDEEPSKLPPPMYLVGQAYKQLDGCTVLIIGVSNPNTSYETVYSVDKEGSVVHRYNRRDFGCCVGSDPEKPHPRNLEKC